MLSASLLAGLRRIVGEENVLTRPGDLIPYECDAFTIERRIPAAAALPGSADEVQAVIELLHKAGVPFIPRGAGTGLSGGTIPEEGSVLIGLTRMRRVLAVDPRNRRALVETGCINTHVSRAAAPFGLHFAPDPSSQHASTIGGNIIENSGGPHTLKHGVTVNHLEAVECVLPDGRRVWFKGGRAADPGYDLAGLLCGSEGTLAVATRAVVRLIPNPPAIRTLLAVFDSVDDATECISRIIADGIVPAALEMMDDSVIQAVEEAFAIGFPLDAGALLLIELDGLEASVESEGRRVEELCRRMGAREIRAAEDARERAELWRARKVGVGALGRLSPSLVTQDGVVPRSKLPEIIRIIRGVSERHGLRIANVMHAGDGNLHPIICFDERDPDQVRRTLAASREILEACVRLGGSVSGEHGIGVEKIEFLPLLFSDEDLEAMRLIRRVFNPDDLCNPGKIFPTQKSCAVEILRPRPAAIGL